MRMRRKKNLEEKLADCGDYIIYMDLEERDYRQAESFRDLLDFRELFGNDNPVQMEVGCGKGQFACEIAQKNPDINFIAVEKSSNVIVDAAKKAKELELSNLRFLRGGAEYLPCFVPEKSVSRIYLNFSCPFPKKSYASHRLTHKVFLDIYKRLMADGCEIHQKTDNMHFFEFSLESLTQNGFALKNISLDLHSSDFEGNIVTEYEQRFSSQGLPIYRLEAYLK